VEQHTKKRIGRPPGRTAPHRPVVSARVPKKLYAAIKGTARAAGRTVGEELIWRVERSFEWQQAFESIPALQAKARETIRQELKAALIEGGYHRVHAIGGSAWLEPGVDPANWIPKLDPDMLEELLERAAARGAKLAREGERP
jgi:hypothetical protein